MNDLFWLGILAIDVISASLLGEFLSQLGYVCVTTSNTELHVGEVDIAYW
jgi:hypothetical protein